jgi:hypothetical protein
MTNGLWGIWRGVWEWLVRDWDRLYLLLEASGLLGAPQPAPAPFEGAVGMALRPVSPSADFRERLGQNLSLAAGQRGGLIVEEHRPYRQALVLSMSAAVLAAGIATAVAVTRSRSGADAR